MEDYNEVKRHAASFATYSSAGVAERYIRVLKYFLLICDVIQRAV